MNKTLTVPSAIPSHLQQPTPQRFHFQFHFTEIFIHFTNKCQSAILKFEHLPYCHNFLVGASDRRTIFATMRANKNFAALPKNI